MRPTRLNAQVKLILARLRYRDRPSIRDWKRHGGYSILCALAALSVVLSMAGCKPPKNSGNVTGETVNSATNDDKNNNTATASATLPPNATPTDVARAALQAISAKDQAALKSLVAAKKVRQDLEAITRGRASFQGLVDNGVDTAVKAIMTEINWLDVDGREIDQELITGATALVTVKGTRSSQSMTRRIFLVLEDNQWRLVPSHR